MHDPGADFFCFSNIPEIFTQIPAGSADDIHFCMILISTLRAFPFKIIIDHDLAVISAALAVI